MQISLPAFFAFCPKIIIYIICIESQKSSCYSVAMIKQGARDKKQHCCLE